eukprot:GHVP01055050.1.p1 GENE.GHVP01055050.1~~GHVP01055050.1.p1  ORF type:complete len:118 (+),score=8.42 GHVP01055050.1:124-477(+)
MSTKVQEDHYELPPYVKGKTVLHFHFPNASGYFQVTISNCSYEETKEHQQNRHCPNRQCVFFGIRLNPESRNTFTDIANKCMEIPNAYYKFVPRRIVDEDDDNHSASMSVFSSMDTS